MFIFLTGMLFSLLPGLTNFIEEECKTELSKKIGEESDSETDTEGGDSDTDSDDKASEFLSAYLRVNWSRTHINTPVFHGVKLNYRCYHFNITTPPPEA